MHQNDSSAGDSPASSNPVQASETPTLPEIHEIALIFPPMSERDFEALVADIKEHGLREPIWTFLGKVIDGRHRLLACQRLNVTPLFREWDGNGSLLEFVISLNLHRRHLKETQRAMIAARILPKFEEEAKKRFGGRNCAPNSTLDNCPELGNASDHAGKIVNVSGKSVLRARKVIENGCPALIDAVDRCKITVTAAAKLAERPHDQQQELLALDRKAIAEALRESAPKVSRRPEASGTEAMPQAPPPDVPSAHHTPIYDQRVADEWLLQNYHPGNTKLTRDQWGFRLEFSGNPIDGLRAAMCDEFQLLRMFERGFRVVWKRG